MPDNQPTIEQNSQFAAKTKDGQDVQFVATIKFYVSPTESVQITAPGSRSLGPPASAPPPPQASSSLPPSQASPSTTQVSPQASVNIEVKDQPNHSASMRVGEGEIHGGIRRDESIDRAFPRGPPDDCPITQFIPDPCRAIDDIQKSLKSFLSGFFGPGCPPCHSTHNVRMADSSHTTAKAEEETTSGGNKTESEAMENEQKYEV
uniref:Uncharacterized protein n=1 Tax=Graphocephala atropunctata TaxID=36148 RepID=A0A1B6MEK2_9HEMI